VFLKKTKRVLINIPPSHQISLFLRSKHKQPIDLDNFLRVRLSNVFESFHHSHQNDNILPSGHTKSYVPVNMPIIIKIM